MQFDAQGAAESLVGHLKQPALTTAVNAALMHAYLMGEGHERRKGDTLAQHLAVLAACVFRYDGTPLRAEVTHRGVLLSMGFGTEALTTPVSMHFIPWSRFNSIGGKKGYEAILSEMQNAFDERMLAGGSALEEEDLRWLRA